MRSTRVGPENAVRILLRTRAMHTILVVMMIILVLAGSFTARREVRNETLVVASVGLISLGVAGRRTMR